MNVLKELVGNSKTLPKVFKAKYNEVLSFQKKTAKDPFSTCSGTAHYSRREGKSPLKFLIVRAGGEKKKRMQRCEN